VIVGAVHAISIALRVVNILPDEVLDAVRRVRGLSKGG